VQQLKHIQKWGGNAAQIYKLKQQIHGQSKVIGQ
jgi:hypothetical protein